MESESELESFERLQIMINKLSLMNHELKNEIAELKVKNAMLLDAIEKIGSEEMIKKINEAKLNEAKEG